MTAALPTLVLSRRPRDLLGAGWDDARSWFGGEPQLGSQPWPRGGARQAPMYFVAQIDLAEVGREIAGRGGPLPSPDGALAFFVGSDAEGWVSGAVVHVPRAELGRPTAPPPDAPAVLTPGSYPFPETFDEADPRLFPRWPVDITALDVAPAADPDSYGDEVHAEQVAAVERRFTRPQYGFSAATAYQRLGDAPRPYRWYGAQHYAACLRTALRGAPALAAHRREWLDAARAELARRRPAGVAGVLSALGIRPRAKSADETEAEDAVARREAQLADLERLAPEFERFVRDVADWVRGADPWQPMPPDAVAVLESTFARGRTAFRDFVRFSTPSSLEDLQTETLLALATADDRAYATMPEAVRTLLNTEHLVPPQMWHQMFGRGVDIQGNAAWENEGRLMLLQLVYDDVLHWRFGDVGAYQFWIAPDDLAAGNWAAVRVTFEGH